jgi:hypothetical protein
MNFFRALQYSETWLHIIRESAQKHEREVLKKMSTLKKFRFPALIGAGVIAAGVLVYVSNTRINSRQTEGAIGQRDVYRDAKVDSADVGTPGVAPVAAQAILESKEFQSLAKSDAFHNLMADQSFAQLTRNAQFLSMMRNAAFLRRLDSESFQQMLRTGSAAELASQLRNLNSADATYQKSAKKSAENDAFQKLASNATFQSWLKTHADSHTLDLIQRSDFQGLLMRSDFQSALQSGMGARLMSNLTPVNAKK